MPIEPPATPWQFPDPTGAIDDLVALGADLEPGTLLAAYRRGLFPMPVDGELGWWAPRHRGVLPLGGLRVSRSLRRSSQRFEVRVDTAFADVVAACGAPDRPGAWITGDVARAYAVLHELGWAHSVETWREGRLVGGLYGVAVGGLFAGESMFHHETDASKVALRALVHLLAGSGDADRRLLDVQWRTEHLASLGVVEVPRTRYAALLAVALQLPAPTFHPGRCSPFGAA